MKHSTCDRGLSLFIKEINDNYIGISLVIVYCLVMHALFHYVCPFRLLTGIPCPGCGLSRAGIALVTFRLDRVMFYNPVIIPIALYAVYWAACRYILGRKVRYQTAFIILLAVLLFALYFYRLAAFFPNHRPMEYVPENFFSPIYRLIGEYFTSISV